MLTVEYDSDSGFACCDGAVKEWVDKHIRLYNTVGHTTLVIGTETLINGFRLAVLDDEISHNDIQFMHNGEVLTVNTYGVLPSYPAGFCDLGMYQALAFITGASRKKRGLE